LPKPAEVAKKQQKIEIKKAWSTASAAARSLTCATSPPSSGAAR